MRFFSGNDLAGDHLPDHGRIIDLGNGLSTSGGTLAASLGAGLTFSGSKIAWTASTAPYTRTNTGAVARTMQSRLDSGVVHSADFGDPQRSTRIGADRIERVKEMLDSLPPDVEMKLTDLAAFHGMSVRSLSRHFKQMFGSTVLGYVSGRRKTVPALPLSAMNSRLIKRRTSLDLITQPTFPRRFVNATDTPKRSSAQTKIGVFGTPWR